MIRRAASPRRRNWYLLAGLILGFLAGLLYAWVVSPVKYTDTAPGSLRSDFKDQYRLLIASAYQDTGNLGRAQARLALLDDPDPVGALENQANRAFLAGNSANPDSPLFTLAEALQSNPAGTLIPGSTATGRAIPGTGTPAGNSTPSRGLLSTPRATVTPTATPGAPFVMTEQANLCQPGLGSVLEVEVRNAAGQPVPGAELVITWADGEDHFFTGLEPELGNGFADYRMISGVLYTLQIAANSVPVVGLTPPSCTDQNGKTYWGGVRLVMQQP